MADSLALLEARVARLDGLPPVPGRGARRPPARHGLPPIPGEGPALATPEPRARASAPAPGGKGGQPCGNSWISPDYTCRQGAGPAAAPAAAAPAPASVPSAGTSAAAPDLRPTLSMASDLDTYLRNYLEGGSDMTRSRRQEVQAYAQQRGLSDWELSAVIQYTRFSYRDVNAALRGLGQPRSPDLKPDEALVHAELLHSSLQKLPTVPGTVWRGASLDAEHLAEFQVGRVGADLGFQSTTRESPYGAMGPDGVASSFSTGALDVSREREVIFEYAPGHGARSIERLSMSDEEEALIEPGRRFRVVGVSSFADELQRRKGAREKWAEGITLVRLEAVDPRLDSSGKRRLLGLLHDQGSIGGSNHLDAGRLQPAQDFVQGAALLSRGIAGPGQDHAVAESVGGAGHGDHLVWANPIGAALDSIEARLKRLDARRVKQAPGQMGLDLGGQGQACGNSWISPDYTCHKGGGTTQTGQPAPSHEEVSWALRQYTTMNHGGVKRRQALMAQRQGFTLSAHGSLIAEWAESEEGDFPAEKSGNQRIDRAIDVAEDFIARSEKYQGEVYRGLWLRGGDGEQKPADFLEELAGGVLSATMESWSADPGVARRFSGNDSAANFATAAVVLRQQNRFGVELGRYGHGLQKEQEVLQPAGIRYRVLSVKVQEMLNYPESDEPRAFPHYRYEVEVEPVEHRPFKPKTQGADALMDSLEARLARLDARRVKQAPGQMGLDLGGQGQACGNSWISPDYTCHKGGGGVDRAAAGNERFMALHAATQARKAEKAAAMAAQESKLAAAKPAAGLELGQDKQGRLLVNGEPVKQLSKGNYGDTYRVDTPDGPVLVKVDRLNGGDPMERDPIVSRERQRLNMATREVEYLRKAAALGIGPEPLGDVVKLPENGRLAIAYRMVEGAPLKANPWANEPDTEEAAAILAQPGARERLDAGVLRIARVMADAGMEHGDLHGANIVVRPDGSPVLIDWAIADTDPPGSAARRADLEARTLLQMNYYTQTLNRHSPDGEAVANGLAKRSEAAMKGLRAASELQGTFDMEWEERNLTGDSFREALTKANSLVKQGLSYDAAQRQAGVLPMLTPEMKAATAAARDAIFGDAQLQEMRQWVDTQVLGARR